MTIQEYTRLKNNLDDVQRQYDKTTGALEQWESKVKEEFDCNIEEIEEVKKQNKKKLLIEEKKLDQDLEEFENKYREKLK